MCRWCVVVVVVNTFVDLSSLVLDWHVRQLVMHKKMKHDPLKKAYRMNFEIAKKSNSTRIVLFQTREEEEIPKKWTGPFNICEYVFDNCVTHTPYLFASPSLLFLLHFHSAADRFKVEKFQFLWLIISNRFSKTHLMRSRLFQEN